MIGYLTRNRGRTPNWQVRIHSTAKECDAPICVCHAYPVTKSFSDSRWGGEQVARMHAENYLYRVRAAYLRVARMERVA